MDSGSLILSINAGSSSVKLSVYRSNGQSGHIEKLADAEISGLSSPPPKLKYSRGSAGAAQDDQLGDDVKDHETAFKQILDLLLQDQRLPQLKRRDDIRYACHRIVHGGDLQHSQVIDQTTYSYLEELSDLAPLHNGPGLAIIRAVRDILPHTTNMAHFDSAFHSTIPPHIRAYAIDPEVAEKNKLRKYGFHGISYDFITRSVASFLHKPTQDVNIIALHLGSGASACAIQHGQSLDNSMGLTPLAGLPGGSRSGDVDPSLVFHYTHNAGKPSLASTKQMHITTAEEILNKESGFKALAGTSDFGVISKKATGGDKKCKMAFDLFVDRIAGFVGSYYVKLGGRVDALVFAGGIGEKGSFLRQRVVEHAACLGFALDSAKNDKPTEADVVVDIGVAGAAHRTLICRTDEQFEMARACVAEAEKPRPSS